MMISWTKKSLSQLHPRQGGPGLAKPKKVDRAKAFEEMAAQVSAVEPWEKWDVGMAKADPECRRLMEAVRHKLHQGRERALTGPLDLEVEQAAAGMMWSPPDRVLEYWAEIESPAFALQALLGGWGFDLGGAFEPKVGQYRWLVRRSIPTHERFVTAMSELGPLKAMRRCLALCSPAAYGEAREAARVLYASGPPGMRAALAYAFPTEADWAEECLAEALTQGHMAGYRWALLSCQLSLASARSLVETATGRSNFSKGYLSAYDFAVSLVDIHGGEAFGMLGHLLDCAGVVDDRRAAVQGMVNLVSPDVLRTLLGLVGDDKVRGLVADYFREHPDLARTELEKLAQGSGKLAEVARQQLNSMAF